MELETENVVPVYSEKLEAALMEVLTTDDPLDAAGKDFDPVAYLNDIFPHEASISDGFSCFSFLVYTLFFESIGRGVQNFSRILI